MGLEKHVLTVGLAALFSGGAGPAWTEETGIHVVLYDAQHQVPGGLDPIRRALVEEFRSLAVELDCPNGTESVSGGAITIPVVVRSHLASDWGLPADALGAVRGRDRRMIFLFFPAIENALPEIPVGSGTILKRERAFARPWGTGVARVIAHEIVHFLLPDRPHDRAGLFQAHLTEDLLLGSELTLSPATETALRSRLGRLALGARRGGGNEHR